jgi:hypothetical protein
MWGSIWWEIVRSDELMGDCALAVDATRVGAPVVDMLRAVGSAWLRFDGGGDYWRGAWVWCGVGAEEIRMGAEGSREHDDLVIALALACWRAKRRQNDWSGGGRLTGM